MVIFIVGGTTYEEARSVALYNAANPGVRFFLGGSLVLNSKRYALFTISLNNSISIQMYMRPFCFFFFFLLGVEYVAFQICCLVIMP